jgi:hypothetical protein
LDATARLVDPITRPASTAYGSSINFDAGLFSFRKLKEKEMSQFEPDDNLGNPWLAIVIGIACLVLAWYFYAKVGADPQLIGKAAIANSGLGRKLFAGFMTIVGAFFIFRGIAKLRAKD